MIITCMEYVKSYEQARVILIPVETTSFQPRVVASMYVCIKCDILESFKQKQMTPYTLHYTVHHIFTQ